MQYLLALTFLSSFFVTSFFFVLLSTKAGVHVTGVVLRGRSLKMVKPHSAAAAKLSRCSGNFLLPSSSCPSSSFFPVLIIYRRPRYDIRSQRFFPLTLGWSQTSLKQVQLLLHRQFSESTLKTSSV